MKQFLTEFYAETDEGKVFTYAEQLTDIAHREQVELVIDLDDVAEVSAILSTSKFKIMFELLVLNLKTVTPLFYLTLSQCCKDALSLPPSLSLSLSLPLSLSLSLPLSLSLSLPLSLSLSPSLPLSPSPYLSFSPLTV